MYKRKQLAEDWKSLRPGLYARAAWDIQTRGKSVLYK